MWMGADDFVWMNMNMFEVLVCWLCLSNVRQWLERVAGRFKATFEQILASDIFWHKTSSVDIGGWVETVLWSYGQLPLLRKVLNSSEYPFIGRMTQIESKRQKSAFNLIFQYQKARKPTLNHSLHLWASKSSNNSEAFIQNHFLSTNCSTLRILCDEYCVVNPFELHFQVCTCEFLFEIVRHVNERLI